MRISAARAFRRRRSTSAARRILRLAEIRLQFGGGTGRRHAHGRDTGEAHLQAAGDGAFLRLALDQGDRVVLDGEFERALGGDGDAGRGEIAFLAGEFQVPVRPADRLEPVVVDGDGVQRLGRGRQLLRDLGVIGQTLLVAGEPVQVFPIGGVVPGQGQAVAGRVPAPAAVLGHQAGGFGFVRQLGSTVGQRLLRLFLLGERLFVRRYRCRERATLVPSLLHGTLLFGGGGEPGLGQFQFLAQFFDRLPGGPVLVDFRAQPGDRLAAATDVGAGTLAGFGVPLHLGQRRFGSVPGGDGFLVVGLEVGEPGPPGLQRVITLVLGAGGVQEVRVLRARGTGSGAGRLVQGVGQPAGTLQVRGLETRALLRQQRLPEGEIDGRPEYLGGPLVGFAAAHLLAVRRLYLERRLGRLVVGLGVDEAIVARVDLRHHRAADVPADGHHRPDRLLLRGIQFADQRQQRLHEGRLAGLVRPFDDRHAIAEAHVARLDATPVLEHQAAQTHQAVAGREDMAVSVAMRGPTEATSPVQRIGIGTAGRDMPMKFQGNLNFGAGSRSVPVASLRAGQPERISGGFTMKQRGRGNALVLILLLGTAAVQAGELGSERALPRHLHDGEETTLSAAELVGHGRLLFDARWTGQDGGGRPFTTGTGRDLADPSAPLVFPRNFNRLSGPDANSCAGCHNQPRSGGAGDQVANVFVLGQRFDFATFDDSDPIPVRGGRDESGRVVTLQDIANERNTVGMFGSGYIEMLARRITAALQDQRDRLGPGESVMLTAKGIEFGRLARDGDGSWDVSGLSTLPAPSLTSTGPDDPPSLLIRPFHQASAVVSLREFANNAFNHHHGMQSAERFGTGDPDGDGHRSELTRADLTAVSLFQATLAVPGRVIPRDRQIEAAVLEGEARFLAIGCADCHRPALRLEQGGWIFTEPNPYNPAGNLRPGEAAVVAVNLNSGEFERPRLHARRDVVAVPAYTDFRLHDITSGSGDGDPDPNCEPLNMHFAPGSAEFFAGNCRFLTARLWGVASTAPYFHHGKFTTLREAIEAHAGEADYARENWRRLDDRGRDTIIEFLKTLRVLPAGVPARIVDEHYRPRHWEGELR
ncbi:MAG: di-heme oxidoredictase family protein [Gammaproteobacteria bacterium]